jgi:hypothetical protein
VIALWVNVALPDAASLIVPPLRSIALAEIARPSASLSPETTGYENTKEVVPDPDE